MTTAVSLTEDLDDDQLDDVIVYAYRVVRHSTIGEVREYHVTFVDGRKGEIKTRL